MPYILNKYYPPRNIIFFLGEGLLIFLSVCLVSLVFIGEAGFSSDFSLHVLRAVLVTAIFQICLYYFDLYDLSIATSFADTTTRVAQAFGVGCIVLAGMYYLFPSIIITTEVFFIGYLAICCGMGIWRFFYSIVLERRMFTQPILLLGNSELADEISHEITSKRDTGYRVVSRIGEGKSFTQDNLEKKFADGKEILKTCRDRKVEKIVVALGDRRGKMPIRELMDCKLYGIRIVPGIEFFEGLTGKILVQNVNPSWIIFSEGFKQGRFSWTIKRLIDIIVSSFGLIVSFPIILVTSILIKLESPGPIFYVQERVGEKGKTFDVVKFRSMRQDAEKDGPVWARTDDDRVTRFGKLMRKIRIDEIPQMWTVLRGDMSFVGPRPERPVFVKDLEAIIPYYSLRHNVKPGITGWAQIKYPYGASEEDALHKLEYDLYYIKNMTIRMDLWIIFETIKTVLFQKGAR